MINNSIDFGSAGKFNFSIAGSFHIRIRDAATVNPDAVFANKRLVSLRNKTY